MSDEFEPKKKFTPGKDGRYVEDDLVQLHELDDRIRELIQLRNERVKMINEQIHLNKERLYASEEWFEGSVRGNPVPDRGGEVSYEEVARTTRDNIGRY